MFFCYPLPMEEGNTLFLQGITMTQIDRLLGIMQRLRDPENGCPWDKEQTFSTIAPYTLEETYEVLDAIARQDVAPQYVDVSAGGPK